MYAIRSIVEVSPILWRVSHVKGHQDTNPLHTLDRWAPLNVEMDLIAQELLKETQEISLNQKKQCIYDEGWLVWLKNHKVPSKIKENLYEYVQVDWRQMKLLYGHSLLQRDIG